MGSKTPNPGSAEAIERGCKCPVIDNHHGKGVPHGKDGAPLFWINERCSMHMTDKALESALLPCPFCGSSAQIERSWVPRSGERLAICSNSACVAHHGEQDEQGGWSCETYFNNEAAIAAWNRRAPVSALPGEAEVVGYVTKRAVDSFKAGAIGVRYGFYGSAVGLAEVPLVTLASLQVMQARAEAAERERDDIVQKYTDVLDDFRRKTHRTEAAEARVKELEEALERIDEMLPNPKLPLTHAIKDITTTALTGGSNG